MNAKPSAASVNGQSHGDLRELQEDTTRLAAGALFVLAVGIVTVSTFGFNQINPSLFAIVAGLILVAITARSALRHGPLLASACLVIGLLLIFGLALWSLSPQIIAPWLSFVVLVASALVGWRWSVATAAIGSGAIMMASQHGWILLSGEMSADTAFLSCTAIFVSWVMSRPTRTALDWASSSYDHALAGIQEARLRQAELAQMAKSLSDSYYVLEQLNVDLDRARRAAQEARQLKVQFATWVSHELRTPLNLIIGFCEMMVLSPTTAYGQRLPPGYRDDLDAIYRNACHISALVDDILDLSQIDADRMALHRERATLAQIVDEAIAPAATLFRNRALQIKVNLSEDLPTVFVDRTRIRQIFINLLNNAARFTDSGGVTVRAYRDEQSVIVEVADTGPGIASGDLPYIFQEFHQTGSPTRRRGGNGLGLAVSKRFAELHGGTMWAKSVLEEGTTFFLRLPIDPESAASEPANEPAGRSWDGRLESRVHRHAERSVLIVDDEGEVRRIFQGYLDGYHVLGPGDLRRGAVGTSEPVHAVIVGTEDARKRWGELSCTLPEAQRLPVISCSLRTIQRTAIELGADDYLVKPITRDQLRSALRRVRRKTKEVHRVLIVEDDSEMRRLLFRMVRSIFRHCQVIAAPDGQQALAMLREQPAEVILLDLLMPHIDGYSVIRAVRADPSLRNASIVVVTARGHHSEAVIADDLRLSRDGGLTVAELMRWVKGGLDALLAPGTSDPAPGVAPAA